MALCKIVQTKKIPTSPTLTHLIITKLPPSLIQAQDLKTEEGPSSLLWFLHPHSSHNYPSPINGDHSECGRLPLFKFLAVWELTGGQTLQSVTHRISPLCGPKVEQVGQRDFDKSNRVKDALQKESSFNHVEIRNEKFTGKNAVQLWVQDIYNHLLAILLTLIFPLTTRIVTCQFLCCVFFFNSKDSC